jgi:hypothetical protein
MPIYCGPIPLPPCVSAADSVPCSSLIPHHALNGQDKSHGVPPLVLQDGRVPPAATQTASRSPGDAFPISQKFACTAPKPETPVSPTST